MQGAFEYVPRNPEASVLYRVVAGQLETFLARQQERDRPVPKFVEDEFRAFLDCGVLARGFISVYCDACGHDRLVPLSRRRRGWCPSCGGRRMAETAAHLVDRVFPIVPVRQWVLSVPFGLRYRLAYDSSLLSDVLNVFIRVVFGELRRRARELLRLKSSQCGAVTFVQRFGDALNCAPHFHSLVIIDGVYAADEGGRPEFHELPPPEDDDVARVATLVAERIEGLLKKARFGAGRRSRCRRRALAGRAGLSRDLFRFRARQDRVGTPCGKSRCHRRRSGGRRRPRFATPLRVGWI
jgi:hypothetical protein